MRRRQVAISLICLSSLSASVHSLSSPSPSLSPSVSLLTALHLLLRSLIIPHPNPRHSTLSLHDHAHFSMSTPSHLHPTKEHMRPSHGDYAALSSSSNNTGDVVIPLT
eukprot:m.249706 g.249706  ORF g.249706 m.249706 type:complete len:108 (-) comp17168_c0_seq25:505-828(-)